MRFISLSHYLS